MKAPITVLIARSQSRDTWCMRFRGPFRDPVKNAWWNITICSCIVVGFTVMALQDGDEAPQLWGFLVGALGMEVLFIYSLFKARRGDE